jgi:metal-responsive CopG/Arc/MetJ family transcriptional regulator
MTYGDTEVSLKIPTMLVEKLDTIAKQKYVNRNDVIIDACAYYCQFYDIHNERFPESMRTIFFNLARHDDEFRALLRQVLNNDPSVDANNQKP